MIDLSNNNGAVDFKRLHALGFRRVYLTEGLNPNTGNQVPGIMAARYLILDGLQVRVGGPLYRYLKRNQLRILGRMPKDRARVVAWAYWAAAQPGAAHSYLYGGVPGIGQGTHTDCSGFVVAVYRKVGRSLQRTSQMQYSSAPHHPTRPQLRPADLVCFNYEGPHTHVGIYVGKGYMIADQHTGSGILRVSVDWRHFDGAASYLP